MKKETGYETLQNNLGEFLESDETILWHGWAEPCKLLEETDKARIIRNWVIECVVFGAMLVFYLTMAASVNYKIAAAIVAVLVIVLFAPYREWRKLEHQQYWVTDRRVISGKGKNDFCGIDMELVDAVVVKRLSTGNDCILLCDRIVKEGDQLLRWRSGSPIDGKNPGEVGMVFYNVARAEEALDAIRSVKGPI